MSTYQNSGIMQIVGVTAFVILLIGTAFAPVLSMNVAYAGGDPFEDPFVDDLGVNGDPWGSSGGEGLGGDGCLFWGDCGGGMDDCSYYGDCGYGDDEGGDECAYYGDCYDDYSYGGGSFGGGFSTPRTGGGYPVMYPTVSQPAHSSGSQSQTQDQEQNQSQTTTVSNTNTNVNVNNNTAIAVVQVGAQTASQPSYPSYPSYPTYPAPYCSIYQAQSYGSYGYNRPVYLSWSSSNAQSAYLSNYGSVAVNGSQTVYPTYSTTYTLTVYGYNGQQATCQTTVQMNTYVPPTPVTPYVSLTQIPYTGFDFGVFGNAMYFAAIAIVALGGAYLAVYFIPQLAMATYSSRKFQPVVAPKAPLLFEKEAAAAKVASIVASLKKGTADTMAIVHEKGSLPKIVIDRS